jgi:hypothetical protein
VTWAADLIPALERLQAVLATAGVKASLDRATVQVPGAWITPSTARTHTLAGHGRVRASVLLVAPASGDLNALKILTGLLNKALTVITPDEDVDTSVLLSIRNESLPAFRLAVDLNLNKE